MSRRLMGLVSLIGVVALVACGDSAEIPATGSAMSADPSSLADRSAESASINERFAGTWELVKVERLDVDNQLMPRTEPPGFGRDGTIGYITYDRAGYMGVVIIAPDRQPYSEGGPTPGEARASLASYTSYFGPYTVNEAEDYVTHHLLASRSPNGRRKRQSALLRVSRRPADAPATARRLGSPTGHHLATCSGR